MAGPGTASITRSGPTTERTRGTRTPAAAAARMADASGSADCDASR